MKKGVLFTTGITMMVAIVFSLAILLFHNTQSTENRFSELALLDRLSDIDGMIQNNIRDINYYASGLSIEVDSDSVTFREIISRGAGFAQLMTDYQSYIEETYPGSPEITFDENKMSDIKTKQRMRIMPYGIVYEHDDGLPGEIESYTLDPGTSYENILGYNIALKVYVTSVEVVEEPAQGSGFPVSITITPQGAPYVWEGEITNPAVQNKWQIKLLGSTPEEYWYITIIVGETSNRYLDVDTEKTMSSTLKILLKEPEEEPIEVKYPEELFTIHFEESKLIKKGTVKLV